MARKKIGVRLKLAHETFGSLVDEVLSRSGLSSPDPAAGGVAELILDYPLTWAFGQLDTMNSIERARTLVVTQSGHDAYHDCLASYHVSGVVESTNEPALLSGIYAAAASQRSYQWKSGLTYMELRVTRLLLRGYDTRRVADQLSISYKTVNAHVSNVLGKLGYENRAQLVAGLLSHHRA
jgi:DNA-binding CsgD family transcriptional regulator